MKFYKESKKFNRLFLILLVFTFISGALRKWVFESGSVGNVILLLQLIVPYLIVMYMYGIGFIRDKSILFVYIAYLIIALFNPLNKTIFHGLLGIVLYLSFWWLVYLYYLKREYINLRPVLNIILFFCSVEIILGFIQYQLPASNILNKYADLKQLGENADIALVGDSVRITGTFSYISGYTAFLTFLILFVWALISFQYNINLTAFLLMGCMVATLMSGSRSAALIMLTILIIMLLSEFNQRTIASFIKKLLLPGIIFLLIFLLKGTIGIEDKIAKAFTNFDERRKENAISGEQRQRIFGDLEEIFIDYRGKYPVLGVGLGSTYQGATAVFGTSDYVKEYGYYEGELPRIVLEGGFVLLFFKLVLVIWVISWIEVNTISKITLFILIFYAIPIVFNIYNSIFLALGLILLDNAQLQKKKDLMLKAI